MKACSICMVTKNLSFFGVRDAAKGTLRGDCKECCAKRDRESREKNKGKRFVQNKIWTEKNREKVNACVKKWADKNREKQRSLVLAWAKNNPGKQSARAALYRARRHCAMPTWADRPAIEAIYERARALTVMTGIRHEVDHIVPLKGKSVCGLHVEINLRVITMLENRTKHAKLLDATGAAV